MMKSEELKKAYKHLKKDALMKEVIMSTPALTFLPNKNLYQSLIRAIVGQQLSVKAAETIYQRFLNLFPAKDPAAEVLIRLDDDLLRSCGLSYQKAGYLKNIAQFSITNGLDYRKLYRKTDEDLIAHLTKIKGVGKWTVEMILMFSLNRPDILPVDDLGIQQAMIRLYKLEGKGKVLHQQMTEIAKQWQPYRTIACRHLWRWKDAKN
ncbi:MAG: DNA-3-methyladenine glycosylase family protein [Bacteroidota bacterium]